MVSPMLLLATASSGIVMLASESPGGALLSAIAQMRRSPSLQARERVLSAVRELESSEAAPAEEKQPAGPVCGDGKCEAPEDPSSCGDDCPGVTTPAMCGEEPHSDPGGHAVVWGASHKVESAAECCQRCSEHAAQPKNAKKPCNSWVFCNTYPQCWCVSLRTPYGPEASA